MYSLVRKTLYNTYINKQERTAVSNDILTNAIQEKKKKWIKRKTYRRFETDERAQTL